MSTMRSSFAAGMWFAVVVLAAARVQATEIPTRAERPADVHPGYWNLIYNDFVPGQLDQEVWDNIWRTWEPELVAKAEKASPDERRQMALSRYGLTEAPGREGGVPLQYADDGRGNWSVNCFMCHGGKVMGQVMPGLPNSHVAMETLFQEIVRSKQLLGREVHAAEAAGSLLVPLGKSNGTTNAIIFGVVLAAYRDPDLTVHINRPMPRLIHNDHDAPPWWNMKYKTHLYSDGFAGKGHRALMQFMMTPSNGPEVFHEAEDEFVDIYDWIEQLEAPKYPFAIDHELAKKGEVLFNQTCADCHGTYGENAEFPNKIVPLDVVGTDRARLDSLTPEMRAGYELSWFSNFGEKKSIHDPGGYLAQPLHGIWASAPYLHNGSVPTLYHLFNPDERPVVWKRTVDGYDQEKVGLEVEVFDDLPDGVKGGKEKRTYFDTRLFAKSPAGHEFPDQLEPEEKKAVMEYLKTL